MNQSEREHFYKNIHEAIDIGDLEFLINLSSVIRVYDQKEYNNKTLETQRTKLIFHIVKDTRRDSTSCLDYGYRMKGVPSTLRLISSNKIFMTNIFPIAYTGVVFSHAYVFNVTRQSQLLTEDDFFTLSLTNMDCDDFITKRENIHSYDEYILSNKLAHYFLQKQKYVDYVYILSDLLKQMDNFKLFIKKIKEIPHIFKNEKVIIVYLKEKEIHLDYGYTSDVISFKLEDEVC